MSRDGDRDGARGRRVARSVAAIVFGFLVMSVVVALFDVLFGGGGGEEASDLYVRLRLFVDVLAAAAGGWATAWIAPRRPLRHAAALAVVVGVLGVTSAFVYLGQQPIVYSLLLPVFAVPAVLLGGWMRARRVRSRRGESA